MYQLNGKSSLKAVLLLGAAGAAVTAFSAAAFADETVETVVVTGSRIPQTGLYSASPVTTVSTEEIKQEGKTDVIDILNQLPQVTLDQSGSSNNGQSGTANVDLRGLGARRTLVLIDGKRMAPGDPVDPLPDINEIPAAMIDHVEVLTGGASAVYGSDALAGVVNFIMRKDFEGVELDAQGGIDEAGNTNVADRAAVAAAGAGFNQAPQGVWDGGAADVSLIVGSNTPDDKGNVTGYLTYHRQSDISWAARDFGACVISNKGNTQHACIGSSNKNRFISLDNASLGGLTSTSKGGPTSAGLPVDNFEEGNGANGGFGTVGAGHFVPFGSVPSPQSHYNYGALNELQRPDTRYTGGFFGHYEINHHFDVYSNFMFMDDNTAAVAAPSAVFLGVGVIPNHDNGAFYAINCTNPLMSQQENQILCGQLLPTTTIANTFSSQFGDTLLSLYGAPGPYGNGYDTCGIVQVGISHTICNGQGNQNAKQSLLEIGRRLIENGNRAQQQLHTDFRGQVGMKGDISGDWTYDVYGSIGQSRFVEDQFGDVSKQNIQNALQVDPVTGNCAGASAFPPSGGNCVPLNIFDGLGSVTPGMLKYIDTNGEEWGFTREEMASAVATGDLSFLGIMSPWAKDQIGASFGAEYRDEQIELNPDISLQTNDLSGFGGAVKPTPLSGYHVAEFFTEFRVPIVQDVPFFRDLTAELGYRYSLYSPAGATNTWKADLDWQITDDIKIRGGFNRAVRAPNVLELFVPPNNVLFSGTDPCATSRAGACATVTNAGNSILLACPANQCNNLTGGNPLLKPEVGNTETVGFVATPSFIENFSMTADYYSVKVTQAIGGIPAQETLNFCYAPNASAAAVAFFCPLVHRNSVGQIFGNGYVAAVNVNLGFLEVRGVDVGMNWSKDLDDWGFTGDGSIAASFEGTYSLNSITDSVPIIAGTAVECQGKYGATCGVPTPAWRHKLRLTWTSPWDVDFGFSWRVFSAVHVDNPGDSGLDNHAPFYNWFDLNADWHYSPNIDLRFGVNNVLGIDPPVLSGLTTPLPFGNANTFPGAYDYLGRQFFLAATLKY